jgi:hypothetical protein
MGRDTRRLRTALLAVMALMGCPAVASAQAELAKTLVGTWRGELQARFKKGSETSTNLTLRITSVNQENGKWVGDGRLGPTPVKIDIDTSGSKPSLRFQGASGTGYDLSLLDEQSLVGTVGTATLTAGQAGQFERERPVKLEKKE